MNAIPEPSRSQTCTPSAVQVRAIGGDGEREPLARSDAAAAGGLGPDAAAPGRAGPLSLRAQHCSARRGSVVGDATLAALREFADRRRFRDDPDPVARAFAIDASRQVIVWCALHEPLDVWTERTVTRAEKASVTVGRWEVRRAVVGDGDRVGERLPGTCARVVDGLHDREVSLERAATVRLA